MSKINQTSLNKFKAIIDRNKLFIDNKALSCDDDKKHSMAVSMAVLEEYYNASFQVAYDSLTDGGGDCKVDAFYYSSEGDLTELVLIQSKYKNKYGEIKTFSDDEIDKCVENAIKISTGDKIDNMSKKLEDKIIKYSEDLESADNPSIKINLYFATNGIIHDGHKSRTCVEDAVANNIFCHFIDATEFGETYEVSEAILKCNKKEPKNKKSKSDATDNIFSTTDNSLDGLVVSCSIKNLMEFYNNYGKDALLANNVRFRIKNSPINKAIKNTFINEPEKFSFLNNGITLICQNYTLEPTGGKITNIKLIKPSIVNGGQTTASLYEIYLISEKNPNFNKAGILIRICKASDDLAIRIAEATNSQNKIDIVDLKANDKYQNIIKEYFKVDGIGLLTKKGEDIVYYNDTINTEYLLQLYAALYGDEPGRAKVSKKSIFKKYFDFVFSEKSINDNIYSKLKRSYEISNFLYGKKEKSSDASFIENAWYSIIYTMNEFNKNIENPAIPIKNLKLDSYYDKAIELLNDIINEKRIVLKNKFSMNNLFKGSEIKDLIDLKIEKLNSAIEKLQQ